MIIVPKIVLSPGNIYKVDHMEMFIVIRASRGAMILTCTCVSVRGGTAK